MQHSLRSMLRKLTDFLFSHASNVHLITALYWLLLFIGTHLPRIPEPLERVSDKTLHFLAYMGLSLLLSISALASRRLTTSRIIGLWFLCAIYALLDELLQIPVGRSADAWDWVADMSGVTLATLIVATLNGLATFLRLNRELPQIPEDHRTEK